MSNVVGAAVRESGRPMIRHEWLDRLTGQDLEDALELVRVAWDYDAEAGFTRVPESLVRQHLPAPGPTVVHHLTVRGDLDDLTWDGQGGDLLAYLHLTVTGDEALARYVVHPDHRSRGVTTMLFEQLGLDATDDGWLGTGAHAVRGWAFGHHPAAERFARRFRLDQLSRTWQLLRHLTGPFAVELPEAPVPAGVSIDATAAPIEPEAREDIDRVCRESGMSEAERQQVVISLGESDGLIRCARDAAGTLIGFSVAAPRTGLVDGLTAGTVRALVVTERHQRAGLGLALLVPTLAALRQEGAQVALLRIDPAHRRALRMTRLLSFERHRDDACYGFGDAAQRGARTLLDADDKG